MSGLSPVDSRATEVDLTVTKVWSVREAQRYINGELQESYKQSSFDSALGKPMVDLADYMALRTALTARENALREFAEHGLRFDLNPTHDLSYTRTEAGTRAAEFWHQYIKRMDERVRERAQEALK
jgi:hypothetical protein